VGIASRSGHAESLEDLLRRADLALYAAKAGGGGRSELAPSLELPVAARPA
jgi:predicted signal transduction protein with EAL and GGDEF domain